MSRHPLIAKVIAEVRPRYTLTSEDALEAVISLALGAIDQDVPGDFVETGTWMGGCSYAMLLAQRAKYGEIRRQVWMYDSFQGMSPPCAEDGKQAHDWYAISETKPKDVANNDFCIAPLDQVKQNIRELGLGDHIVLCPGWLADTLPVRKPKQIAFLRIDCDWYEPVKLVWEHMQPLLAKGAPIIVDDYYAWPGASLATHEYLTEQKLAWPLISIAGMHGAWTVKA